MTEGLVRCSWAEGNPLLMAYHDEEWGVPVHDDRRLFELLTLEGAQAGLSWLTVLKKREAYRVAFSRFDPAFVSTFDEADVERLMANEGIIRNRGKIESAVKNALCVLAVQREFGSFDAWIWQFAAERTRRARRAATSEVPARTEVSDAMCQALRKRGFSFVGSTICYAFMQSAGMVNDHDVSCFRSRNLV